MNRIKNTYVLTYGSLSAEINTPEHYVFMVRARNRGELVRYLIDNLDDNIILDYFKHVLSADYRGNTSELQDEFEDDIADCVDDDYELIKLLQLKLPEYSTEFIYDSLCYTGLEGDGTTHRWSTVQEIKNTDIYG